MSIHVVLDSTNVSLTTNGPTTNVTVPTTHDTVLTDGLNINPTIPNDDGNIAGCLTN